MCNETLTETLEKHFGSSDTCNNFVKNHMTIDGNKQAHRIPYQASYKYTQRVLPKKEVLPRLQGPRGIYVTTKDHKSTHNGLANIDTQLR
jgi:hypothetical protein